jgi:peptide/nickel transport system permease protein
VSGAIVGEVPAQTGGGPAAVAVGPWRLAGRRLRRNRVALAMARLLLLIVVACLCAPLYAHHVAHTDPFQSNLDGTTVVNGKSVPVMVQSTQGLGLGVTPIGPTWDLHHYFFGADEQGRDVAARLLYGGRNSLLIGTSAALITSALALLVGLVAGFFGGIVDGVLSRLLDVVWAFPVYLLAISLSTVLIARGISWGPFHLTSGSLLLPIAIIGLVYIPYVARPIRGEVLSLRRR